MVAKVGEETRLYASELLAEVGEHARLEGHEAFMAEAFTDLVLDELEEEGFWPDYQLSYFSQRGIEVSVWGIDEGTATLYLGVTDFEYTNSLVTMSATERTAVLKRLLNFFTKARSGAIDLPGHSPVVDLAQVIEEGDQFTNVRCSLLTNRIVNADEPDADEHDEYAFHYRTWDLETIRRFRQTGSSLEPIEVDLIDRFGEGVACLEAPTSPDGVEIRLAFVPGQVLADIYLEFGPRLLERNVRSFLMARGKINQGIRDTLRFEPDRFLSFNNGITATASDVEIKPGSNGVPRITRLSELQIVNGGQTTASIAVAARDPEVDLKDVVVQMKLAVIAPDLVDDLVPDISQYANRQNAVQSTDLSANHPHLRLLQHASRTEWTPSEGGGRATKWYFERARGAYAVEKSETGTAAGQKRFTAIYPTSQKFGKSEVALYELTWMQRPHIVCRGGQKAFAEYMDKGIPELGELDDDALQGEYRQIYRDLVARAILFKATDRIVYRGLHGTHEALGGTYKRPVVAYTLAYLLHANAKAPDLGLIWRTQKVSDSVAYALADIAAPLKDTLLSTGHGLNITEWAKKEECWALLSEEAFPYRKIDDAVAAPARAQRPVKPAAPTSPGERATLADAIEAVFGEPIKGSWKRFRRQRWRHLGNTGITGQSGRGLLHLFDADFTDTDGRPYTLVVAVDFPTRAIIPVDELPARLRSGIEAWLLAHFPSALRG